MILSYGALWLIPVLSLPLTLAVAAHLPAMRPHSLSLLPLAPLPALATALFAPEGSAFEAPDLLLGAQLALEGNARLFLGFAAFLWTAAGIFARTYMRGDERAGGFAALWCLTLAGNLGVFLAADVATFYVSFACVSLAAYPLVVHTRSAKAMRAGLVYIVLALAGETALLLGFMLAASSAETLLIADMREAMVDSPWQGAVLTLLVAGFGIKAGLVPLHVWLPLAHPAAPTPASAVLSGAIVKAGIFGLIQFLPFGVDLRFWHEALLSAGLATAFYGVAIGLTQQNPKTVLAYSTVSQMGLVVAVLATALQQGSPEIALAAASFYALHHGLAKGALFMGVGVVGASGKRSLVPVLATLTLPALSLAGLPLTGGALAKLGAKPPLGGGAAELLFTLSAVGTALLMLRFMLKVAATGSHEPDARPAAGLLVPWLASVAAGLIVPWLLFTGVTGLPAAYPLAPDNLLSAFWPVAAAGVVGALVAVARLGAPGIPEGDLLIPAPDTGARLLSMIPARPHWIAALRLPEKRLMLDRVAGEWASRAERLLSRWSISGALLLMLVILATL